MNDGLGPQPDPVIEPKEPNPGGVDAIEGDDAPPAVHDLDPESNPAIEDAAPDELKEPEETDSGEPKTDGASEPESESPA